MKTKTILAAVALLVSFAQAPLIPGIQNGNLIQPAHDICVCESTAGDQNNATSQTVSQIEITMGNEKPIRKSLMGKKQPISSVPGERLLGSGHKEGRPGPIPKNEF